MKREDSEDTTNKSPESDLTSEAEIINFSANLVSCLKEKKKLFNEENKSSITIDQLKEVYRRGTDSEKNDLNWKPCEEDYELAKSDQEKFDLKLNFSSFDELYIETYKPLDFNWE